MTAPVRALRETNVLEPVAIVCGAGALPEVVARGAAERGRRVVLFPLRGAASGEWLNDHAHHWITMGQIGRVMRLAGREGCRDITFVGGVVRPTIADWRPDLGGLRLLPRFIRLLRHGDWGMMAGLAQLFEERGFHVVAPETFAPELLMPAGALTNRQPSDRDHADIARGLAYLRAAAAFEIGQAVIVAGRRILAVEAVEGTDNMLARFAELRQAGQVKLLAGTGVLVKAPQPQQDRRLDLPTIGPRTIERVSAAQLSGVAVLAQSSLVVEAPRVATLADERKLFVVGVTDGVGLA